MLVFVLIFLYVRIVYLYHGGIKHESCTRNEYKKSDSKVMEYEIITNNTLVYQKYQKRFTVRMNEDEYEQVLIKVRDLVHRGWRLCTHPLAGSIKPNETPYRSIVIRKGSGLDCQSLELIENSINVYRGFIRNTTPPAWSEKILDDFRVVDLNILESALENNSIRF